MQSNYNYKDQFFKNGSFQINDLFSKADLKNLEINLQEKFSLKKKVGKKMICLFKAI